jgi:aspartate/methionine/tyrosine aminotransferase
MDNHSIFNMVDVNPQAIELNETIKENNNTVYELLSGRGKAIFFPKKGILAQAADAKGKEINATIGIALEEDLTPMRLKPLAKLTKKLDPKDIFPYAPSFGKPELREKWKQMILQKNPSIKNEISLPVVTNALTHGLSIVSYLFLNNEESIILPDKFWGNYKLIFTNTYGAQLDTFNMFKDGLFDLESFQNKLNENQNTKKVILLNFPNNPTGYTIINEEAEKITELIKQQAEKGDKIAVIIDDAYFGLVYKDDVYKESIFSKLSNLHENVLAIKVDGSTKEDYVWGFRVGFLTFGIKNGTKELYQALENKTAGAIRGTISNSPNISQSLLLKAFEAKNYQKEKEKKYNLLKARYEEVRNILRDEKYGKFFKPLPFNSGYFMCIELKDLDAEQVRQILLNKYSTGIIAMGNLIRIAFSSINKKSIQKLFDNIYNACSEIKGESNGK